MHVTTYVFEFLGMMKATEGFFSTAKWEVEDKK